MIKEKTVKVKWCYQNKEHYEKLGYKYTHNLDSFEIPIEHLSNGSNIKITAICDNCGAEKLIKYQDYVKSKNAGENSKYNCAKCSHLKTKSTCIKRYGGISPLCNKNVRTKIEETCIERYGVANPFANSEIQDKIKATNMKKYGVDNVFKDIDYIKFKNVEKYGVDHHFKLEKYKAKISGENSHNWNPNLSNEDRAKSRRSEADIEWRKNVFERDKYICQICGFDKGGILEAHHLNGWNAYPDERYIVENGITLCKHCHKLFHNEYGYGNNTKKQFEKFIDDYKV